MCCNELQCVGMCKNDIGNQQLRERQRTLCIYGKTDTAMTPCSKKTRAGCTRALDVVVAHKKQVPVRRTTRVRVILQLSFIPASEPRAVMS